MNDVKKISEIVNDQSNLWQVTNVEETLAKQDEKEYKTTVNVELENSMYSGGKKTVDLHYSYYDKGGWVLEDYQNISSISKVKPKTGISESEARSNLNLADGEVANLITHETSLDNPSDYYEFELSYNGTAWNEKRTVALKYQTNDSGFWKLADSSEINAHKEFNKMDDYWFYDIYEDLISFYRIDSFSEDRAQITEVYTRVVYESILSDKKKYGDITHSYNEGYLSPKHLETDSFVCNRRDCTVTYDDDAQGYICYYEDTNGKSHYVYKWLNRDGLFDFNTYNKKVSLKTTKNMEDITSLAIPDEILKWVDQK
ncbi:MAG: hypothetical protein IJT85_03750 [Ruminococcus sp.]|nr:hypothetical protein [Ruminococcus sp.]